MALTVPRLRKVVTELWRLGHEPISEDEFFRAIATEFSASSLTVSNAARAIHKMGFMYPENGVWFFTTEFKGEAEKNVKNTDGDYTI